MHMNEPQKSAVWGTLIVILLVIVVIVLVAYFAWWVPAHRGIAKIYRPSGGIITFVPLGPQYINRIFLHAICVPTWFQWPACLRIAVLFAVE